MEYLGISFNTDFICNSILGEWTKDKYIILDSKPIISVDIMLNLLTLINTLFKSLYRYSHKKLE
jgi:hypothetical protein